LIKQANLRVFFVTGLLSVKLQIKLYSVAVEKDDCYYA